jgi:hypothetical protein
MSALQIGLSEQQIQKSVFAHLRARAVPGALFWHPFSGGFRRPKEAAIYKGLGAIAGLPDVMVLHAGQLYAIELKTETGRPTETQLRVIDAIRAAGGHAVVCRGLDRTIACLEAWGILRGTSA